MSLKKEKKQELWQYLSKFQRHKMIATCWLHLLRMARTPQLLFPLCCLLNQKDSSAQRFSSMTWASSSGVKSFSILKNWRISCTLLPLIIEATLAHDSSRRGLMSKQLAAMTTSKSISWSTFTQSACHQSTTWLRSVLDNGFSISGGGLSLACSQKTITFSMMGLVT